MPAVSQFNNLIFRISYRIAKASRKTYASPSPIISVVIPAFNEESLIASTIQRIRLAMDASPEIANRYEMIVCDNNSPDATAAIAKSLGCTIVSEPIYQISRARNRGASMASGKWLLFIDADSWPPAELIADMVPHLKRIDLIGCGATIRVVDGPKWFKFTWESKNWSMRIFKWSPGAFILCRRDAFEQVGGFPEDYFIFEELEFVKRLRRLGRDQGQTFAILHKHPFCTSGRKGEYGIWYWAKFGVRIMFSPRKSVRDRSVAEKWYDIER